MVGQVHRDSDLDDTHHRILGSSLRAAGYLDNKTQSAHKLPRHSTDHGDGMVSGDTMNVYIPWYAPESDINILSKPSVINIQPLMKVQ